MGDVIDLPVELPPFTEDMRAAIRECRFKTVNQAHTDRAFENRRREKRRASYQSERP